MPAARCAIARILRRGVTDTTVVQVETRVGSTSFTVDYATHEEVAAQVTNYADCFDGLVGVIDDPDLIQVMIAEARPAEEPATAIEKFVMQALGPEGRDITVRKATAKEAADELERRRWIEDNN